MKIRRSVLVPALAALCALTPVTAAQAAPPPFPITRLAGSDEVAVVSTDATGDRVVLNANGSASVYDRSSRRTFTLAGRAGVISGDGTKVFAVNTDSGAVTREVVGSGATTNVRFTLPSPGDWFPTELDVDRTGRWLALEASDGVFATQSVFLIDSTTGRVIQVTKPQGSQCVDPSISDTGNRVAYRCFSTVGAAAQTYVYDRTTGRRLVVSRNRAGGESAGSSRSAQISGNGRFVVFTSDAGDLVSGASAGTVRIYRRNLAAKTTVLVSSLQNNRGATPVINTSGKRIAYLGPITVLIGADTFEDDGVYIWTNGRQRQVMFDRTGGAPSGGSSSFALSGNGKVVAFSSFATDLTSEGRSGAFVAVLPRP